MWEMIGHFFRRVTGTDSCALTTIVGLALTMAGCQRDAASSTETMPSTTAAPCCQAKVPAPATAPASHPTAGPENEHADGHGHHREQASRGLVCFDVNAEAGGKTLHVLTGAKQQAGTPPVLSYERSDDAGKTWSPPVRVDANLPPANRANAGMDARIVGAGNALLAIWSSEGTGFMKSGPLTVARSTDGGRTWGAGVNPADDGSTAGHDFIAVAADEAGRFHLAWLDGRNGRQGLRYARSDNAGDTWSKNVTLDDETCECCWNRIAVDGDTVAVLYRDKGSRDVGPRDMRVVRSTDAGATWSSPAAAGAFGWLFHGCPHTGGGIALADAGGKTRAHAVVWTGKSDAVGVHLVDSDDGGQTWSGPRTLGGPRANRPDIAVSADGKRMAAVWEVYTEAGPAVFAAHSSDGFWSQVRGQVSPPDVSAEYARVVATPTGFRAFWIESAKSDGAPRTTWATAEVAP